MSIWLRLSGLHINTPAFTQLLSSLCRLDCVLLPLLQLRKRRSAERLHCPLVAETCNIHQAESAHPSSGPPWSSPWVLWARRSATWPQDEVGKRRGERRLHLSWQEVCEEEAQLKSEVWTLTVFDHADELFSNKKPLTVFQLRVKDAAHVVFKWLQVSTDPWSAC